MRIGLGYDVHRLKKGRKLLIGGVEIPHEKGLMGHSDADCLLHAIIDAILGALAIGDIGGYFPDNDPAYKDANSRNLLRQVASIAREKGWRAENIDAVVIAERPKLAPYIENMRINIAEDLGVERSCVNIKATTNEKMGFIGREEGIAAQAVVLLKGIG